MAQHDYVIANGTGAAVRSDLNNGLAAIVSQNSGTTEPTTTYAYMRWADTTAGVMKMRNGANNAWITLYQLDGEWSTIAFENGSASAPSIYFKDSGTDTGIYSPGTDQVAISTNGTGRLFVDSSGRVGIGTSAPNAILSVKPSASSTTGATTFTGDAIYIDCANTTNAIGSYGGAISWSRAGISTTRQAAITNVQTGSDPDVQGLAFLTHSSATGTDPLIEAMRITGAGNVGIGVTPAAQLDVKATSGTLFRCEYTGVAQLNIGNGGSSINYYDGDTQIFRSGGGTERARIDSSGRLLVGTSTARSNFYNSTTITPILQTEGAGSNSTRAISHTFGNGGNDGPLLVLAKHRSTSVGGITIVQNGDETGWLSFQGSDGSDFVETANIKSEVDGTPGANDMPGRLVFSTTADGASSPTERMRIASTGRITLDVNTSTGGFYISNWSSGVGSSTVKYNTSTGQLTFDSSSRLVKEGITDCLYGINAIKQLQPRIYTRKDGGELEIGFIADEMQAVIPELVPTGPKSAITGNAEDTEDIPIAVNYDKFVAVLTKALQEAITKIEALEAAVTALQQS